MVAMLMVILASILVLIITKNPIILTGKTVSDQQIKIYSYTKAICTENNFCQDYLIECKGYEIQGTTLIENAYVQHPKNWEDPKEEKELCYRN